MYILCEYMMQVFNGWKKELEDDEEELLKEKKKKAEDAREARRKMAHIRKLYESQRIWMVAKLIALIGNTPKSVLEGSKQVTFSTAFQEELENELRDKAKIHNPEANATEVLKIKANLSAHAQLQRAEEKLTKVLFGNIAAWTLRNDAIKEFNDNHAKLQAAQVSIHHDLMNCI